MKKRTGNSKRTDGSQNHHKKRFVAVYVLLLIFGALFVWQTWSSNIAALELQPVSVIYFNAVLNTLQAGVIVIAAFLLVTALYGLLVRNDELAESRDRLAEFTVLAKNSENEHKLLISQMSQGFALHEIILDENGVPADYRFLTVNKAFEVMTGLKADDVLGRTVLEVLPNTEHYWIATYGKVALTGEPTQFDNYSAEFDKYFSVHVYSPQPNRFAVIITDMTNRHKGEAKLRKSEEKFRNMFEHAPVGIFHFNEEAIITDCNENFVEIIGSSFDALIGLNTLKLPDKKIVACIEGVFQGRVTDYRDVYRSVTAEKKTPIIGKFAPIFSKDGRIIGGTGIIEDITERKKIGDELRLKSLVLEQLEEFITITDLDGTITYVNQAQVNVFKRPKSDMVGKKTTVFSRGDIDADAQQNIILKRTLRDGSWRGEVINRTADGQDIYLDCRTQVVSSQEGRPVALAGIASNITARKMMERELYKEKEMFKTTLLSVGDGVISSDSEGRVVVLNHVAETLTGWSLDEAAGRPLTEVFNIIDEFSRQPIENPVERVLKSGESFELSNHTILVARDGTGIFIEDSAAPILDENGNITGAVLVFRDFTEKRLKQQEVEFLSFHDQLTGLFNRRYYETQMKLLDKNHQYPLALIMADVNGLKLTNDAFGHAAGDELLKKVADILKDVCRGNDTVARIGGDEFVLLLPETGEEQARRVMERILTRIAEEQVRDLVLSVSMGCAVKTDAAMSVHEVFMKAEDSMYRHKLSESTSMRSKTIALIMNSLFAKSKREMHHSQRVGKLCEDIGTALGFANSELNQIRLAGLMHDIGKIGISESLLDKPAKLDDGEWNEVRRHAEIGYRILGSVNEFSVIADFVLEHHERPDGDGYPRGLTGDDISLQAKIITLADTYDAMTSDRPYRNALDKAQAVAEIRRCAGTQFDAQVSRVLVEKVLDETWNEQEN